MLLNKECFNIRYIKLHFTLEFIEDTVMPVYKTSALRGGMGELLLQSFCINKRECNDCEYESDCTVRKIMYPPMEIQPGFMSTKDSIGFVIECEDYHEYYYAGDRMKFNMILLGKTVMHFSNILHAFQELGQKGLGKEFGKYKIVLVTNSINDPVFDENGIRMENYNVRTVADYISFRKNQIKGMEGDIQLKFKSPTTIKYRGEILDEYNINAIIESLCRRIYMLDCFEGITSQIHDKEYVESIAVPEQKQTEQKNISVRRFSNHSKSAMYLNGIEGNVTLSDVSPELFEILLAGELVHIGKNTSFGFGRYRIVCNDK